MDHLKSRYMRALEAEAALAAPGWRKENIDSVFLGGGTPTTLPSAELGALIASLRERFDLAADAEVTVEANPDTVDEQSLSELLAAGYSRLSMGAQSFDPAVLASLERVHSPESVRRAFAAARASGYANMNLDLIYGATGETMESWGATLAEAIELGPEHVSAYALTIEPSTPLGRKVSSGSAPAPDPDLQADMFAFACDELRGAGYLHYEVSNWAKRGFECRHNLTYWNRRAYLGLGAGAHSFRSGMRWWNIRPPEQYLETVERGELPIGGKESLTDAESRLENLFLHLRTSRGVPAAQVEAAAAAPFLEQGLLARSNGNYVLTDRGMFVANEVILALAG
jgi:oxygen-independent coproporphyrinogen-3 oxidase